MALYQPCKIYSICHASSSSTILLLLPCQDPHTAQCKHKPITNGYKVLPTKHLTAWSSSLLHSCSTKVKQYHLHLFMDTSTGKTQQHAKNILHLVQWKSTLKKTMTFFFPSFDVWPTHFISSDVWLPFIYCLKNKQKTNYKWCWREIPLVISYLKNCIIPCFVYLHQQCTFLWRMQV